MTHVGFALDLPDIDLSNIDLLDTHFDLLDTDIISKNFVYLRDVLKTCLQDVLSVTISRLPRRLARGLENVFKTSSRRLGRHKIVTLKTC